MKTYIRYVVYIYVFGICFVNILTSQSWATDYVLEQASTSVNGSGKTYDSSDSSTPDITSGLSTGDIRCIKKWRENLNNK